jgi:uncharacterized protein
VAGLAAWNIGAEAKRFATVPAERASSLDYFRITSDPAGGPIRANANALLSDMSSHAAAWDYLSQAKAIGSRALLLVAATRDSPDEDVAMHQRMAQAVRNAGGRLVKSVQYEDDHPFSSHRVALAELLTQWLDSDCARTQGMR